LDLLRYKITGTSDVALSQYPTKYDGDLDDAELKNLAVDSWAELADLQQRLYAESEQSLLVVLQAMDAAGKDSTIAKLTRKLNAQSCKIQSFKKPSKLEMSHDFLWRVHAAAPAAGDIGIFNRSHYEDVLVVKVHGWASEDIINRRYEHINNFESLLADRGTKVVKFMLNISPEYQLDRFKRRLDVPGKNWKFNPGDLDERKLWDDYMQSFEVAMSRCASEQAPWYVVPAENRRFRDAMIASVLVETLNDLDPQYPEPTFDIKEFNSNNIE